MGIDDEDFKNMFGSLTNFATTSSADFPAGANLKVLD